MCKGVKQRFYKKQLLSYGDDARLHMRSKSESKESKKPYSAMQLLFTAKICGTEIPLHLGNISDFLYN